MKDWNWKPARITKAILKAGLSPAEILAQAAQSALYETEFTGPEKMKVHDKIFAGLVFPEFWGESPDTYELRDRIALQAGIRQELCYLEYPKAPNVARSCSTQYPDALEQAMRTWQVKWKLGRHAGL